MVRRQRTNDEFGGVFIEAGLVIPFLALALFLLTGAIRISRNYIALTLIAREAVMSASTLEGLDTYLNISVVPPTDSQIRQCYDASMTNYQPPAGLKQECARRLLSKRIAGLSRSYNLTMADQQLTVSLTRNPANGLLTAEVRNMLPHFMSQLPAVTIRATATGSYDA